MSIKVGEYALIIKNSSGVLFSEKGTLEELQFRKTEYENYNDACTHDFQKFKVWIVQVVED